MLPKVSVLSLDFSLFFPSLLSAAEIRPQPPGRRSMGTSAQTADDPSQSAAICRLRREAAGGGSFRLGMRVSSGHRHPPARSCHAGGRGFESRRSRFSLPLQRRGFSWRRTDQVPRCRGPVVAYTRRRCDGLTLADNAPRSAAGVKHARPWQGTQKTGFGRPADRRRTQCRIREQRRDAHVGGELGVPGIHRQSDQGATSRQLRPAEGGMPGKVPPVPREADGTRVLARVERDSLAHQKPD